MPRTTAVNTLSGKARTALSCASTARKALYDSADYTPDQTGARDLLCDLLHFMHSEGMDVGTEVRAAVRSFDAERVD